MPEVLDAIEIETGKNPTASVIWLHGLGADGNDFAPIVRELRLPQLAIRFVFPHAPVREKLSAEASTANRDVPIFMGHGSDDPIIPLVRAEQSRNLLKSLGYPVEWRGYGMPHSVCPEELTDIGTWLGKVLGPGA